VNAKYSLIDFFRLIYSVAITWLFFRPARVIRQPTRIRGFSNMSVGRGFTTGQFCRIEAGNSCSTTSKKSLVIGERVQINDACHIAAAASISIGDDVLIASRVYITDHDHGVASAESILLKPIDRDLIVSPVIIGDRVWIGEGVSILKGVVIGEDSIVGAGAVVTKSFPPRSVIVGVPARLLKTL
jgi:lipopolysaccharide O-acetyltransferase